MSTRIQYARVVRPKLEFGEVVELDGHVDSFEKSMNVRHVIVVRKHPDYKNWYLGFPIIDKDIYYNYHRSWLKFVPKPKENK